MPNKPKLDLTVKGTTGLPVWSGRVYDEVLVDLQGDRGRQIYREMSEQDPIIGGTLLGIEMLSRQVPWSITPVDETEKAKEVADFVDGALSDMSPVFGNVLSEILTMLTYGWSWLEIVYKRREGMKPQDAVHSSRFDDGKVGWGSWSIRSQETLDSWLYENDDPTKQLIGMRQMGPPDYKEHDIPRWKSLHFKTRSRRENPEGVSVLRNCYRPWYMKKNIEVIEGIGIERDLAGLPVMWAPANLFSENATAEEKSLFAQLRKIVTQIKRDEQEGVLMPLAYDEEGKNPLYKLELLSTGGDRQFDTNAIINRYDERIAMSMLADFILMGHQAVGSYALSTTKTGLFSTALSAFMDVIADEINSTAIPQLVLLNGWSLDLVPTLQHGKIETADLSKLGEFLNQLASAGMRIFPNVALETHLLKQAGLPSDPGAGDLPLPIDEESVAALLGQMQNPPPLPDQPGALPGETPQLPAGNKPAVPAKPKPPATDQPPARAHEAKRHHRHFTPLVNRVTKISSALMGLMTEEEYKTFLATVVATGSFGKLPPQYQEFILKAEEAG